VTWRGGCLNRRGRGREGGRERESPPNPIAIFLHIMDSQRIRKEPTE